MRVKYRRETDGKCFADRNDGCYVMGADAPMRGCNTYLCPFYKPKDCEDWIRIEKKNYLVMIPPEEYSKRSMTNAD